MFNLKKHRPETQAELQQIGELIVRLPDDLSMYKDLIAYPVTNAREGYDFEGGLVDPAARQLVETAVLTRGKGPSQKMPVDDYDNSDISGLPFLSGTYFYGGILIDNFGHFLLESISRLWAYPMFEKYELPLLFYIPQGIKNYKKKTNYIHQAFQGFGIPLKRLIFLDRVVRLERVIVPRQKYGFRVCRTPEASFVNFVKSFRLPDRFFNRATPEKIYVSRSLLPMSQGRPLGENFFEKYVKDNGYTVIYPEKCSLYEQLAIYKAAKKIIFCDGGATYCTVLLPGLTASIAVIARRRDHRGNYRDITEHFYGYRQPVLWIDEVVGQYQYGRETWDAVGEIDWHKVSVALKEEGFVESTFEESGTEEYVAARRAELQQYIREISGSSLFMKYMENLQEKHPVLPSTLYDEPV